MYACGNCGGSEHLHGAEFPRRKMICDNCGQINIYPWEKAYEEGSSLWPMSEPHLMECGLLQEEQDGNDNP